jgi:hypothetical protein
MWVFWQTQTIKSYQKETGVIEKIRAAGEDFEKLWKSVS